MKVHPSGGLRRDSSAAFFASFTAAKDWSTQSAALGGLSSERDAEFAAPGFSPGCSRTAAEPLLDGFRTLYGAGTAKLLALCALIGLVASFHTIIFAYGRQIYSLSRAGYYPSFMSLTHGTRKTPHTALLTGTVIGLCGRWRINSKIRPT